MTHCWLIQKSCLLKVEGLDKQSLLELKLSSLSAGIFKCLSPEHCILLAGSLNFDFGICILFYLQVRGINLLFTSQKRAQWLGSGVPLTAWSLYLSTELNVWHRSSTTPEQWHFLRPSGKYIKQNWKIFHLTGTDWLPLLIYFSSAVKKIAKRVEVWRRGHRARAERWLSRLGLEREVTGWGGSEQRDKDLVPAEEQELWGAVGMGEGGGDNKQKPELLPQRTAGERRGLLVKYQE